MNAWNNKTFEKIVTQEYQEKKVNWHECVGEYDKQMFIYVVQRKKIHLYCINNGKKTSHSPIKNLTKHLFLKKKMYHRSLTEK